MLYNIPKNLSFFRFKKFPEYKKVLMTNITWDWIIVWEKQFNKIIKWDLSKSLEIKLEKNWFLKTEDNKKNIIKAYRNKHGYLSYGPTLHIISLTKWCNLNCIYCHSKAIWKDVNKYHLTKEIADKYIKIILTSKSSMLTIEFQWWEPTLNWDVLTYIVNQINKQKKDKKINFTTTTNLFYMPDEKIKFLLENNFKINISVDWSNLIHNKNRPAVNWKNSFENLKENLKRVRYFEKKYKKELITWWIAVITRYSLAYPKELAQTYKELWLHFILTKYLDWLWKSEYIKDYIWYKMKDFIDFYKKYLDEIWNINNNWYKLIDGFVHIFIKKILWKTNPWYVDLQNPCGASIWQVAYDWDGKIYTCDEWRTIEGGIFSLWDYTKINDVKDIVQNETTSIMSNCSCLESNVCDMCAYQPYCWTCPIHNYINFGEIFVDIRKTPRHKFNNFLQNFVFKKEITKDKNRLKMFKNWLK